MNALAFLPVFLAIQLWFVTIIIASSRQNDGNTENDKAEADEHTQSAANADPSPVSFPTPNHGWHPQERQHRRGEQRYWGLSLFINFVTMVGALGAAIAAAAAYTQAKRQADAAYQQAASGAEAATQARRQADAATRSYLYVSASNFESISDWTFGKGLIRVKLAFTNYGVAPAIFKDARCYIAWYPHMVFDKERKWPDGNVFAQLPSDERSEPEDEAVGHIILPKETYNVTCADAWPRNNPWVDERSGERRTAINTGYGIWVIATVTYNDAIGGTHFSNFCALNDGGLDPISVETDACYERD